ncbi:MAG TPA: flavodoxin domain-containing protein [Bacillota bacterium]|nr:flavodoxin domain-containing protein [Bacillota bacterium]HOK68230.1 flavodoxin domain-containing protein [Bacillota bacterium]HPP85451.1 flavodoxin domain-containing protein [Bacillota bacterium]
MVIVYASKTGFTKKYAEMLSAKTGMKAYSVNELTGISPDEEIVFLGWIKVGKIQGLNKVRNLKLKAVCATGTARTAEPSEEAVKTRNKIEDIPFFYLRGGCLPLKEMPFWDRVMLSMFVRVLKSRKDPDEETKEAIEHIQNGYNGVKEENLAPVLEWLNKSE